MDGFIDKATPLGLALLLSLIGIAAVLISEGSSLLAESDPMKRQALAAHLLLSSLPPNMCLAAFSFDIWVITTLFTADQKALDLYNLKGKSNAIQLLLVGHICFYLVVLAWGGLVRGPIKPSPFRHLIFECILGAGSIVLCIIFQAYKP